MSKYALKKSVHKPNLFVIRASRNDREAVNDRVYIIRDKKGFRNNV